MKNKKILFVDDDRYEMLGLIERLEAEDFEITHFTSPDDAIKLIEKDFKPDLIISDLVMSSSQSNSPSDDRYAGIHFCRDIKEKYHLKCPIIVLTAIVREEIQQDAKTYADQLLVKPVPPGYLVKCVKEALEG